MKKVIAMVLCTILSTGLFHASAGSCDKTEEGYKIVYETREVAVYDCETGEETIVDETYETYVVPDDARKDFSLESPGYFPNGNDRT